MVLRQLHFLFYLTFFYAHSAAQDPLCFLDGLRSFGTPGDDNHHTYHQTAGHNRNQHGDHSKDHPSQK